MDEYIRKEIEEVTTLREARVLEEKYQTWLDEDQEALDHAYTNAEQERYQYSTSAYDHLARVGGLSGTSENINRRQEAVDKYQEAIRVLRAKMARLA